MRLAAYAGVSVSLAAGVILRALNERPNFYSATVYLAQSNACRLILLNVGLLFVGTFMVSLQRLLYGPLRPIEIEQLWDKAWYAITETALAMTVFRDEVGGWFFVMFVSLLAGKVWSWISEGRVEILEQQPPTNPRLFHARLITSLLLSEAFDLLMLRYCINTLLEQPKPGMMVMFAFEFAVLAITSTSTTARYALSLQETLVIKKQTAAKIEERREERRAAREEAQQQAAAAGAESADDTAAAAQDEEIDENEIDVPGWQDKGRWVLFLDLTTDFLKLLVYICFFVILLVFHGIPIHILRDVLLTTRSFLKRIVDFLRYRNATRDMNERYPDATAEELARDGTCIICREEMRPWQQPEQRPDPPAGARRPARTPTDERQRPKKLPCGHVLHFGCLRSWLERQQVCPTCRASVLVPNNRGNQPGHGNAPAGAHPGNPAAPNFPNGPRGDAPADARARVWNIGPYRLAFAAGNPQQVQNALQRARNQNHNHNHNHQHRHQRFTDFFGAYRQRQANAGSFTPAEQLASLEQQIMQEINTLNATQEQLATVRQLQAELERLRGLYPNQNRAFNGAQPQQPFPHMAAANPLQHPAFPHLHWQNPALHPVAVQQQAFRSIPQQTALGPGHADLPPGLTLPEGWSLVPLQRTGGAHGAPTALAEQPQTVAEPEPIPEVVQSVQLPRAASGSLARRAQTNPQPTPTAQPSISADGTALPEISNAVAVEPDSYNDNQQQGPAAPAVPDWSNAGFGIASDPDAPSSSATGAAQSTVNGDSHQAEAEPSTSSSANGHVTSPKVSDRSTTVEDAVEDE